MVRLEHKTLIFYYLGTEIPKSRSITFLRGPPGPVCHTQNKNSFSQFARIRQNIPFLSTKRGSTGTGSSQTKKNFCQKMFQLTQSRCVNFFWTFGAVNIWHLQAKIPTFFPLKSTAIPLKICISGKTWFPNHGFALNIKMGHWCAKFWTPPQMGHVPFF